ncbi:MAG: BON domain-containing protein [Myxococcota bacterium]
MTPPRRSRTIALAAIVIATTGAWTVTHAAAAGAAPKTPAQVIEERVAGSIEDRVRIGLQTAGGNLADADIAVAADAQGHVTLSGEVPSSEAKARAERLASYAVGVKEIDNQLQVNAPPAPPPVAANAVQNAVAPPVDPADRPSDEALARSVARSVADGLSIEARARHRWLRGWWVVGDGWSFEVDVDDGRVRLDGRISDRVDVEAVVARARTVPAVRSVDASLEQVDADRKGFFERIF